MNKTLGNFLGVAAVLAAMHVHAQTPWFTVVGDMGDPNVNTVQVDPTPVAVEGESRTMTIRVSRSAVRTSWEGVTYRSYTAKVVFDCVANTARYSSLAFYMQPYWTGEIHQVSVYPPEKVRLMEFRDVQPNPTARIVKAACTIGKPAAS